MQFVQFGGWGGVKKKTNRKGKEEMPNEPVYTQKKCHMAQK